MSQAARLIKKKRIVTFHPNLFSSLIIKLPPPCDSPFGNGKKNLLRAVARSRKILLQLLTSNYFALIQLSRSN